jgi:hypothetical protein
MTIPKVSLSPAALDATIRSCYEGIKRAVKTRDGPTFKQLHYDLAIALFQKNPNQNLDQSLKHFNIYQKTCGASSEEQQKRLDYYYLVLNTFQNAHFEYKECSKK